MKKQIIVITFFVVCILAMFSISVNADYLTDTPNLLVSLTKQEPDPVEPGKIVEVSFKIENYGKETKNLVFEILPEYPFSLLTGETQTTSLGTIKALQDGKQSVIIKYKLRVAQDANDGNHKIKIRYKDDNYLSGVILSNSTIKVQTHDAILSVEKFFTTPSITSPGGKTKLRLELKNYATSILKDIKVALNLEKIGDTIIPFNPLETTNEKVIPYIEPQAVLPIEFELLADSDAVSKAYKVPLTIKYSDAMNKNYTKTNLVTIIIGDTPDLGISLERTDIYTSDSTGSLVLRIVNKGTVDIKFLNVMIMQNENVLVIGANEVYIGKLDSDDFSTADFKLFVKGKNSVKIPVQVSYKDANNKDYTENKEVLLTLYSQEDIKRFGIKKNNNYGWVVIVVILIIGAYYYIRRRKKK